MRYFVCVIVLALCLVAWQCSADGGVGVGGQLEQRESGALTASAAPQKGAPGGPDKTNEPEVKVEAPAEEDDEDDDDEGEDTDGDALSPSGPEERTREELNRPQEVRATTTTKKPEGQPGKVQIPQSDNDRLSTPKQHSPLQTPNTEEQLAAPGQNTDGSTNADKPDVKPATITPPEAGVQQGVSSSTGGKTTTTAAVQTYSEPQGDKLKEHSTPPKDGGSTDLNVTDAAAAATTTMTNAPPNSFPKQSKIQQSVNNKDISSNTPLLFAFATLITLTVVSVVSVC